MRSSLKEAATYALSDVDYAFLSTAPALSGALWREVRSTWTEGAALALSDVDYAFLSTAPSRKKEVSSTWTWTWIDTAISVWARCCA